MITPTHNHIVKSFDAELDRLADEITAMGDAALAQVEGVLRALQQRDATLAQAVIDGDDAIDARERDIGHEALRLLALRQPTARDLREVLAAIRIAADIERIGDHAVAIARLSLANGDDATIPDDLFAMGALAGVIAREAMAAWQAQDVALAQAAWVRDDELDRGHAQFVKITVDALRARPERAADAMRRLFVAKNLERIGDHASNIAENVCFLVEGETGVSMRDRCGSL